MIQNNTTRVWVLFGAAILAGCNSDSSPVSADDKQGPDFASEQPVSAPALSIPHARTGIWRGTDSAGHQYVLMAGPTGARIADVTLDYASPAFGELNGSRNAESPVEGYAFWAFSTLADIGSYGWSLCVLFVAEWQTGLPIDGSLNCAQMPDGDWERDISLEFDSLYDIDADLSLLAGTWTGSGDPGADVLSIDETGHLSGQSASNDCIYAGQAAVINSGFNLYSIDWSFDNCSGDDAGLNGVVFTGLATLTPEDDWWNDGPATLTFTGTGRTFIPPYEENGLGISFTAIYEKY